MKTALTPRQVQVIRLIAAGFVNKEIAGQLGIATSTVDKHCDQILRRLSARTRAHAVFIFYSDAKTAYQAVLEMGSFDA